MNANSCNHYKNIIAQLVVNDPLRLHALQLIDRLDLPHCYIAAGFIRNLIWDHLHQKPESTRLNDIDVIYFDPNQQDQHLASFYEQQLNEQMPELNWQVRNQAIMHLRNGDRPYRDISDAMSFWPEKETAVAIRLMGCGQQDISEQIVASDDLDTHPEFEIVAPFGLESLFALQISYNSKRELATFLQRVESKSWLKQWPKLSVKLPEVKDT